MRSASSFRTNLRPVAFGRDDFSDGPDEMAVWRKLSPRTQILKRGGRESPAVYVYV
jgi:hypothetical protein